MTQSIYIINSNSDFEEYIKRQSIYSIADIVFLKSIEDFFRKYELKPIDFKFSILIHPELFGNAIITEDDLLDVKTINNTVKGRTEFSGMNIPIITRSNSISKDISKVNNPKKVTNIDIFGFDAFDATKNGLPEFIEELPVFQKTENGVIVINDSDTSQKSLEYQPKNKKLFISHSSNDKDKINLFVELLENIGLKKQQHLFYSSNPYSGVGQGEKIINRLKSELSDNVFVLFILSDNFYKSDICLCEMGAVWIKSNKQVPIIIPPFNFSEIEGVISGDLAIKINDKDALNILKDNILNYLGIESIEPYSWEEKRDTYLERINSLLPPEK